MCQSWKAYNAGHVARVQEALKRGKSVSKELDMLASGLRGNQNIAECRELLRRADDVCGIVTPQLRIDIGAFCGRILADDYENNYGDLGGYTEHRGDGGVARSISFFMVAPKPDPNDSGADSAGAAGEVDSHHIEQFENEGGVAHAPDFAEMV